MSYANGIDEMRTAGKKMPLQERALLIRHLIERLDDLDEQNPATFMDAGSFKAISGIQGW
ncbi:MAG: hypothetical protein RBR22_00875 [Desulfuromonas sp.]|nr:hypothetical protein [Desulfuromonas sp.]